MIEKQIELEKRMTQLAVEKYKLEYEKSVQKGNLSDTQAGNTILSIILNDYTQKIKEYIEDYRRGKAVRSTLAAEIIDKTGCEKSALIAGKIILNSLSLFKVQSVYKLIGQALEDDFKMYECRKANKSYYKSIQEDLNSRQAKMQRKKYITLNMFRKRLDFHCEKWSTSAKVQAGMVLTKLFTDTTGLVSLKEYYQRKKPVRYLEPSKELMELADKINEKLEVMNPFYLPMVCKPKDWTDIFSGGYLSPYLKRNKVIKNHDREYLIKLRETLPKRVYDALNTIQSTPWHINGRVLELVQALWEEGQAVAGLPKREDDYISPFPYPEMTKDTVYTKEQREAVKKWKRETYETHKTNVARRSIRILTSRILRIADDFKGYEKIYFPYQLDFRGRLYPLPVLLNPQGTDLSKGLLEFAEGKPLKDKAAVDWFYIHGANMYGIDKVSYKDRIKWVNDNKERILESAKQPLKYRFWTNADKPIQFIAWCFEFSNFNDDSSTFISKIAVQLDGTCNGLQHYGAMLRDEVAGKAVNLINSDKPNDIYQIVADRLTEKLKADSDNILSQKWLSLGITRKLTKRPVMVLPYGGTRQSCRSYIEEYLEDNYSDEFLFNHFKAGYTLAECKFRASYVLSLKLWEAIKDTVKSATCGMDYIRALAKQALRYQTNLDWITPLGLPIHQAYKKSKTLEIKTELYGTHLKVKFKTDDNKPSLMKQLNGICPNFIHSLDASHLMLWLLKCKEQGITSFMTVHDCYGVLAADTEKSARLLREAFVEIYERPILDDFEADLTDNLPDDIELPEKPKQGKLNIQDVLTSDYFFN